MIRPEPLARALAVVIGLALLSACQTDSREQLLKTGKSQVALRSIQSRVFDTTDRKKTLRTIIATMQDLGFVVDKADAILGSVSGTKFDQATFRLPYRLRMTVTVRPRGGAQLMVRANAQYNIAPVEDPEPYQNFFSALSKAMFLEAHMLEGGAGVAAGGFGSGSASQATAAATTAPGGSDARESAVAALPPGSRADFESDRSEIVQAITDYYEMGGFSNDGVGSSELTKIKSLQLHKAMGDVLEVDARYSAVRTYDAEIRTRTSRFTLKKQDNAYQVIAMRLLRKE